MNFEKQQKQLEQQQKELIIKKQDAIWKLKIEKRNLINIIIKILDEESQIETFQQDNYKTLMFNNSEEQTKCYSFIAKTNELTQFIKTLES